MLKKAVLVAICTTMASAASPVIAASFKLPVKASEAPATGADAVSMQEGIIKSYVSSKTNVDAGLAKFAAAYGLKDEAAKLDASVKTLAGGATSENDLKTNAALSESTQQQIAKKISEGVALSDEGKRLFASGLLPFALGVKGTTALPKELQSFSDAAKAQISSASVLEKAKVTSKLQAGMWLVKELPGYTSKLTTGVGQILGYAQKNSIPLPKEANDLL
jgi:hypothetical protein